MTIINSLTLLLHMQDEKKMESHKSATKYIPTISTVLSDNVLVEMIYQPKANKAAFVVGTDKEWQTMEKVGINKNDLLVPHQGARAFAEKGVLKLASDVYEYGSESELITDIRDYIHRYVEVSERFEKITAYYVLFSWLFDNFPELPY